MRIGSMVPYSAAVRKMQASGDGWVWISWLMRSRSRQHGPIVGSIRTRQASGYGWVWISWLMRSRSRQHGTILSRSKNKASFRWWLGLDQLINENRRRQHGTIFSQISWVDVYHWAADTIQKNQWYVITWHCSFMGTTIHNWRISPLTFALLDAQLRAQLVDWMSIIDQ